MDTFCHISEFGPQGLENVPALAFVSERLTLWAPAFGLVQDAMQRQYSILGPHDVLALVEQRHLQIMGRERWFTDRAYRASLQVHYPLAAWVDEYDDRLWELALEDRALLPEDRRVLFAPDADGDTWAESVLGSLEPEDRSRLDDVRRLYLSGRYPAGTREKLRRVRTTDEAIRVLLVDIRNHSKAFLDAGADRLALLSDDADAYARALPLGPEIERHSPTVDDTERFLELLKLLKSLSRPRNYKELKHLLERVDRKQLLREVRSLLASDLPAHLALRQEVRSGAPHRAGARTLLGDTPLDMTVTMSGLASALATFHFLPGPFFGLLTALAGPTVQALRQTSVLPVSEYTGPALPFVLAYDRAKPTYSQIAAMVGRLEERL